MNIDIYNSFFVQMMLFILLALVLIISVVSLFIKPAKRTIRASLVDAESGHIIDISRSETSLGRAKACDVVVPDISVSRFHAVLSKRSAGWMIFDTNSTAGIKVNGKKIEDKSLLNDGDSIEMGNIEYIFYSTAVTTRQKYVPRTKTNSASDKPKYRKQSNSNDNNIQYQKRESSSRSSKTQKYERDSKVRRHK